MSPLIQTFSMPWEFEFPSPGSLTSTFLNRTRPDMKPGGASGSAETLNSVGVQVALHTLCECVGVWVCECVGV